jgi:hypothetical protein
LEKRDYIFTSKKHALIWDKDNNIKIFVPSSEKEKARVVMKRIPNIFAYAETRSRDLTVPSIGKERVSTVAKPELKVAVKMTGIFKYMN